ncbi:hypothetical protein K7432_001165 [Basidiobolus ranarum]|uniref:Uncharacterized protein n=1 Tax=Basidiobolus ranarum TaxID=34480 RepID=A0ABR2WA51_9FUNG
MSNLDHAANLIGNYLLKGWVLMDDTCSTPSCSVPLMRSKDNKIKFCVLCDDPEKQSKSEPKKSPLSNEVQNTSEQEDDTYSAIKPDEAEKRRVQSQQASKLIGAKMLQGWAMMEDVCPNESCYGVPLIRSRQDKHLHCVICQKNYLREQDADVENSQSHQNPIDTKPAVPDNDAKPQMKDQIPPAPVVSQETHKEVF